MNIFKYLDKEDWWALLGIALFLGATVSAVHMLTN